MTSAVGAVIRLSDCKMNSFFSADIHILRVVKDEERTFSVTVRRTSTLNECKLANTI